MAILGTEKIVILSSLSIDSITRCPGKVHASMASPHLNPFGKAEADLMLQPLEQKYMAWNSVFKGQSRSNDCNVKLSRQTST